MQPLLISSPDKDGGIAVIKDSSEILALGGTTGAVLGDTIAIGKQDNFLYLMKDGAPTCLRFKRRADIHDVLIKGHLCYAVITWKNAVVEIDMRTHQITRSWNFAKADDSWHINCLGEIGGRICFSAFGKFSAHRGYKSAPEGT